MLVTLVYENMTNHNCYVYIYIYDLTRRGHTLLKDIVGNMLHIICIRI